jgi:hypothetical protein
MTWIKYERLLDAFIDRIFFAADAMSLWPTLLANKADLDPRTVRRINGRTTRLPRLNTILKLADAVGMTLELRELVTNTRRKRA